MTETVDFRPDEPVTARLDRVYQDLPPRAQRVADFVLEHVGEVGTYSVAELADLSSTSTATVSRLFRSIGFQDFAEVKAHIRNLRQEGLPIAAAASLDDAGNDRLRFEVDNLQAAFRAGGDGTVDRVADAIVAAPTVIVMGFRSSFPVAMHLRESLVQARTGVLLVPQQGQSMGEELAQLGDGDIVIVVGFRRRLSQFDDLMRHLATTGAKVVLIADATARRHAVHADIWIDLPIDAPGAFDSYASPMAFSALLADAVLRKRGPAGQRNVARIAGTYESLNELDGADLGYRRSRRQ
ncbi:MAG: MurR/RpiR family transcriptional regulator [Microbacterium sp.]|jgi:DNA-binding MurR/RpiR family transcriptional regulator|uniref:MurR/RpiR family transcriptional regulator n=1 Tax=Microbacterium sp. TaxID=51671 RepID=UPI0026155B9E|nr:MurR/RpiR family transcriptional regulator [Microbacterium sp.]MDF2562032.1 MurR/RpiR family transcriptional regulator [Microbacterium sp.]